MIDIQALKNSASGKWYGIFEALGIDVSDDPKKHTACPICGPGNNSHRFRVSNVNGNGDFICTQCGAGDGITLVMLSKGLILGEALERINSIIGCVEACTTPPAQKKNYRPILTELWQSRKPYRGSQAEKYLNSRGITVIPQNIAFHPACYESDSKLKMPAMLARFQAPDSKPVGIHRTYLKGIQKADIKCCRKMLSCANLNGGAIRLLPPKDGMIGVAEGVETALSCWHLLGIPTWSVYSNIVMENFEPPEGIKTIVIFADQDENFAGQKSAFRLANKLYSKKFKVDVQLPGLWGDWNDVLMSLDGPPPFGEYKQ